MPARLPARLQEVLERDRWAAPTPQDIVNSYRGNEVQLRAQDVILQVGEEGGWEAGRLAGRP